MKLHWQTCRCCHSEFTDEEFDFETNQCKRCRKWDDDKSKRDKEYEERTRFVGGDFEYVAGDPFW